MLMKFILSVVLFTCLAPVADTFANTHFIEECSMVDYTTIQRPSITIVGIQCRTSNAPDAGPKDIPDLWMKFYTDHVAEKIQNRSSNEIIALYCDYESDFTKPYSFVIGCPVSSTDNIPNGMVAKKIAAGSYANYRAIGEYPMSLIQVWEAIWQDIEMKRTYTADYEVYGDKFNSGSPKELDVYVAIESR